MSSSATAPFVVVTGPELIGGRYLVESTIARGGMGEIVLARDRVLGRRVAVKRARPGLAIRRIRSLMRREAQLASRVHHRAVVRVLDLVEGPRGLCLIMEYLVGPSLHALHELGVMQPHAVIRIARELASALGAIHAQQIVHRDLKLENVLLDAEGQPTIIDFGIARCATDRDDERLDEDLPLMGTPRSMAPEQIAGGAVDARADLYALGVLMYELLSGQTPFGTPCPATSMARALGSPHRSLTELGLGSAIPVALSELVDDLLAKDPDLRPQSAAEVIVRLRRTVVRGLGSR